MTDSRELSSVTPRFRVDGTTVTAAGRTPRKASDHFYALNRTGYAITVAPHANLFQHYAIAPGKSPVAGSLAKPGGELIVIDHGSIVNQGRLNVYPASTSPPGSNGCPYCQTAGVIYITGDSGRSSRVVNSGIIGDRVLRSSFGGTTPEHGYGQVDNFGVLMMNGRIVNRASGIITGYNAIFTQGNAAANRIDNYGMIDASNDGVLSSYLIVNHRGAAINTGVAGFACVHAYGNVANFGYMLGQDYGMLLEGSKTTVVTYGGPRVAGVADFDGSPVYNGEISSILRSTGKVNSGGPYLSGDAVMMDAEHSTLTLRSTASGGHVWLPVIKGPMVGGANGDFDSPSAHQSNKLVFDFNGLGAARLGALRAAVARSVHHGVHGRYFSGRADVRGHHYHWVGWTSVAVRGSAAPALTSPAPSSRASRQDLAAPAAYITRPGQPASVAATLVAATTVADASPAGGLPGADTTSIALLIALAAALALALIRGRAGHRTR